MDGGKRMSKDTSVRDFGIGMVLVIVGLFNIFKNTSIGVLQMKAFWGGNLPGGIVTIPLLIGIVIIFLNHKSKIGWGVAVIGTLFMLVQIICSLNIIFHATSLIDYFLMFGGTFGGLALIAKALLRP